MKHIFLLLFFTCSLLGKPHFVLVGPPGSGKGTFSAFIKQTYGYHQICPGDILRTHIKNETPLGKEIKAIVGRGDYVDEQTVFNIIEEQVCSCIDSNIPFIIDGFIRGTSSFDFLVHLLKEKQIDVDTLFVHFTIRDEVCIERIDQRLVCFGCSSVFNTTTRQPTIAMVCDACGNDLEVRLGDTVTNTKKRLAYYREHVEPLVHLAHSDFRVVDVDAEAALSECLSLYATLVTSTH